MSALVLCGLLTFLGQHQIVRSECGWTVEFTDFPNAFKYYSTCNKEQYLNVTMESLVEFSNDLPGHRLQPIAFGLPPAKEWSWVDTVGMSSSYEGFEVSMNQYVANLSSFLRPLGGNATLNLTTYVFEEASNFSMYNSSQVWMDKYSLKWEIDIREWPFVVPGDILKLCLDIQTPNATQTTEGSADWTNISYADGFYFAFPNWCTCDDEMTSVDVEGPNPVPDSTIHQVCLTFPHCAGDIFYDPFISSSYQGVEKEDKDETMKIIEIAGIALAALAVCAVVCCLVMCVRRRKSGLAYTQGLVSNDNSLNYGSEN